MKRTTAKSKAGDLQTEIPGSFSFGEFNTCLLARKDPTLFSTLAAEYGAIVQLAVEESVFRVNRQVFAKVRNLARRAGEKDAGPQDLVAVHISGLAMIGDRIPRPMAKACAQHARLLLLKAIGELALYYRDEVSLARKTDQ